jgi:hypothetical protein
LSSVIYTLSPRQDLFPKFTALPLRTSDFPRRLPSIVLVRRFTQLPIFQQRRCKYITSDIFQDASVPTDLVFAVASPLYLGVCVPHLECPVPLPCKHGCKGRAQYGAVAKPGREVVCLPRGLPRLEASSGGSADSLRDWGRASATTATRRGVVLPNQVDGQSQAFLQNIPDHTHYMCPKFAPRFSRKASPPNDCPNNL